MISEGNNTWRKKHLHMRRYPYLNESVDSVDKNKPYLDKVVDKLKHYTTFAASKSHVYRPFYTAQIPFTGGQKWYIEWFSNSLETGYGFKDGFKYTSPIGHFEANSLGIFDMAGNVWEWCYNWHLPYEGNSQIFPTDLKGKAQRGGSFLCNSNYCHGFRLSARSASSPESSLFHVGFRCVKNITN